MAVTHTPRSWIARVYAIILVLVGLSLTIGGALLAFAGGSLYYLLAGIASSVSGALIWRGDRRAVWLFGALLVATVAWSIWEVGGDVWKLVPRLVAPFVLGLALFLPNVRQATGPASMTSRLGGWPLFIAGMVAAMVVGSALFAAGPGMPSDPVWQTGAKVAVPGQLPTPIAVLSGGEWRAYGNDEGGTRFSPLDQINTGNVSKLKVAWEADTGPRPPGASTGGLEVTPIMIGDTLYICNGTDAVVAFDADTGRRRWSFQMTDSSSGKACRGVTY